MLTALLLIVLHTPDGRPIFVNPVDIVALIEPQAAAKRSHEGNCVVQLLDGTIRTVAETCDMVRSKLSPQ